MKRKTKAEKAAAKGRKIIAAYFLVSAIGVIATWGPVKASQAPVSVDSASDGTSVVSLPYYITTGQTGAETDTAGVSSGLPSKSQKDAVARVCGERFTGAQLSTCYDDLLAIAYTETRFQDPAPIGDHGLAYGSFQLHIKLHGITEGQANDFEWAAGWTLDHMVHYGYPVYRSVGLGSHNSMTPGVNQAYSAMVKAKSSEFQKMGL